MCSEVLIYSKNETVHVFVFLQNLFHGMVFGIRYFAELLLLPIADPMIKCIIGKFV